MKTNTASRCFSALSHPHRLDIFRQLVEAGPGGLPAGEIAEAVGISPSGLTFHIGHLQRAGLVGSRREGRSILYSADFSTMAALVDFLTENCCGGDLDACRNVAGHGLRHP
ncbi:MAG: metalloregulator ArsR/SmtB family transcription factor [Gammaproteobacteria bacterium]|jgi:DNA-binding transcriptional ArsR family regulator